MSYFMHFLVAPVYVKVLITDGKNMQTSNEFRNQSADLTIRLVIHTHTRNIRSSYLPTLKKKIMKGLMFHMKQKLCVYYR